MRRTFKVSPYSVFEFRIGKTSPSYPKTLTLILFCFLILPISQIVTGKVTPVYSNVFAKALSVWVFFHWI